MHTYIVYPTIDQEKALESFLEENNIQFFKDEDEPLPDHVIKGIEEGIADIEAGRFITYEEFKRRFPYR